MFTLEKKEYDEKDLKGESKIAFDNVMVLIKEKNILIHRLEKNKILSEHYSKMLTKNLSNKEVKK